MPITLYGTPCWLDDLLDQLAARLARLKGMTADRVFESLADDETNIGLAPADTFIVVRPRSFPTNPRQVAGGGRLTTPFDGTVDIVLYSRLASDREGRDTRALRERSRSVLRFTRDLLQVLQLFSPTEATPDGDGNTLALLTEPMRLKGFEIIPRPVRGSGGQSWVAIPTSWEMKFRADLAAAVQ